ncbi:isochorismate synthase [Lactococcus garvieae]|nr:isochorismate synthase [Lactococcus garvieae]
MKYRRINLKLKHPLAFWSAFPDPSERFFWYDSQKQTLIIASQRLTTVQEKEIKNYPYVFYSQSFFEQVKGELWQDMGNEIIAFKHYYIQTKTDSYVLSCDPLPDIKDQETVLQHHSYEEEAPEYTEWVKLYKKLQENITSGKTVKIVASREVKFTSLTPFNVEAILERLVQNNPGAFIFAYHKSGKTFLGASPEILVQKTGNQVLSYALAGTMPRALENGAQLLLKDSKNLQEHQIVVQKIKEKLLEKVSQVKIEQTDIMTLKNVYHLQTVLKAEAGEHSLIDWTKHLHPTPALGGYPSHAALDFLRANEKHERGLYAAPLGLIDSQGNGTIIVAIRSALLKDKACYAYAGCGIVAASDCQAEFDETKIKLKTILEAL